MDNACTDVNDIWTDWLDRTSNILCCVYTATWNRANSVPARLGTISGGSVNMTKACQYRAVLAQLALIKWAGTEPARLGTFSPASVNDIEPNPCCNRAVPSTEPVRFSPQNAWQQYHDCVAAFRVFLYLPVHFFCRQKKRPINRSPWSINITRSVLISRDALLDVPPFKSKIDRTRTALNIAV